MRWPRTGLCHWLHSAHHPESASGARSACTSDLPSCVLGQRLRSVMNASQIGADAALLEHTVYCLNLNSQWLPWDHGRTWEDGLGSLECVFTWAGACRAGGRAGDTGADGGWVVAALARACAGGAWASTCAAPELSARVVVMADGRLEGGPAHNHPEQTNNSTKSASLQPSRSRFDLLSV